MIYPQYFLMLYVSFYFLMLIIFFVVAIKKKDSNFLVGVIFISGLSIICGLRSPAVGTDTYAFYLLTKQMVMQNSFLWSKDYIYYGLTRMVFPYFGYIGCVFFPALITSVMIFISYRKIIFNNYHCSFDVRNSRGLTKGFYLLFSLVVLIDSSDMLFQIINQTRQLMSFSFALYGAVFFYYRSFFRALLLFLIATFTHHSAPLIVCCIFLSFYIKDVRFWFFILFLSVIVSMSGMSKPMLSELGLTIDSDSIYYQALNSNTVLYFKSALTCLFGILCFCVVRKHKIKGTLYGFVLNLYMAICSLAIIFVVYGEASNRIQRYAGVIFPILLAMTLCKVRLNSWVIVLIVLLSILYMTFLMTYNATLVTIGIYRIESLPL